MKNIFLKTGLVFFFYYFAFAGNFNPEGQIKEQVSRFFQQKFSVAKENLQINYLRLPNFQFKNSGKIRVEVYSQRSLIKLGYQTLWVKLIRRERLLKKFPISVNVAITKTVWLTNRKIKFHEKITKEMLYSDKRLIRNDYDKLLSSPKAIVGKEARRVIAAGSILTSDLLRSPLAIHSGQKIKLQLMVGNLQIITEGIARGEGEIGDLISVRCLTTGKIFKARIQKQGIARIEREYAL